MPSARWWRRPGCWRGGAGGCWTPRCGGRGRHPRHGHPAGRGDPSGPSADPGSPCGQAWRPRLRPAGQARLRLGRLRRQAGVGIGAGQRRAGVLAAVAYAELGAEQAEAVALLALVTGQDVEAGERPGTFRIARRVARDRVISSVDPPPAGCASPWATGLSALRRLLGARTNRGPGRPGPRWRCQATMPCGSMTYLRAAPLSNSW
jgi:hypothetical protein